MKQIKYCIAGMIKRPIVRTPMTASHLDVRVLPVRRLPPEGVGCVGAEVGQGEDLVALHQDRVLPGRLPVGHISMVMGSDYYGGQELGNRLESENWVLKKMIKSVRELIQLFLCYLIHPRSFKVSPERRCNCTKDCCPQLTSCSPAAWSRCT